MLLVVDNNLVALLQHFKHNYQHLLDTQAVHSMRPTLLLLSNPTYAVSLTVQLLLQVIEQVTMHKMDTCLQIIVQDLLPQIEGL